MTIVLQPEQERLIVEAIKSGAYNTPEQVVARALEILCAEDEWLLETRQQVHEKIERGLEQFERGEFYSAEESRSDMEKRKKVWLGAHIRT